MECPCANFGVVISGFFYILLLLHIVSTELDGVTQDVDNDYLIDFIVYHLRHIRVKLALAF